MITTANLVSAGLPAIAALLGVSLTLAFNARQERARQRADMNKALWDARRVATSKFIVAVNQAADSTRAAKAKGLNPEEAKELDKEGPWSEAYERYLEIALLLPPEGDKLCWQYLQDAYAWRRKHIASTDYIVRGDVHGELTQGLQRWLMPESEKS